MILEARKSSEYKACKKKNLCEKKWQKEKERKRKSKQKKPIAL